MIPLNIELPVVLFLVFMAPDQKPIMHHQDMEDLSTCLEEAKDMLTKFQVANRPGKLQVNCIVTGQPAEEAGG